MNRDAGRPITSPANSRPTPRCGPDGMSWMVALLGCGPGSLVLAGGGNARRHRDWLQPPVACGNESGRQDSHNLDAILTVSLGQLLPSRLQHPRALARQRQVVGSDHSATFSLTQPPMSPRWLPPSPSPATVSCGRRSGSLVGTAAPEAQPAGPDHHRRIYRPLGSHRAPCHHRGCTQAPDGAAA
jgi:hypothetical protein